MLVTIVMTILIFILFMFFVIMFMVYFNYMLSIFGLSLCSCISLYSTHSKDSWVGGRYCVSVVLIRCLPADTPYILGHVIYRGCDTPVESFVVHSSNIGASRARLRRKNKLCSESSLVISLTSPSHASSRTSAVSCKCNHRSKRVYIFFQDRSMELG